MRLVANLEKAAKGMSERMGRFGISSGFSVVLNVFSDRYQIYPSFRHLRLGEEVGDKLERKFDERLEGNILDKKWHWDNAEIGSLISLSRAPKNMNLI